MKHWHRTSSLVFLTVTAFSAVPVVHSLTGYANVFISPAEILNNSYPNTDLAKKTIFSWADVGAQSGPWSKSCTACHQENLHTMRKIIAVTKKPFPPPSGDNHDYMSWAP